MKLCLLAIMPLKNIRKELNVCKSLSERTKILLLIYLLGSSAFGYVRNVWRQRVLFCNDVYNIS